MNRLHPQALHFWVGLTSIFENCALDHVNWVKPERERLKNKFCRMGVWKGVPIYCSRTQLSDVLVISSLF